MTLNIKNEIHLLSNNVSMYIEHNLNRLINHNLEFNYKESDYVITFPYNFYFYQKNVSIEIIREFALINAMYVKYFFKEDDVLDEYHVNKLHYRNYLKLYCEVKKYRNLAIEKLLKICGTDIFTYLIKYEKLFYNSLILEKSNLSISLDKIFNAENTQFIAYKVIPLCLIFAAFCIYENKYEDIEKCEQFIIHFQIASQFLDDLIDLKKDLSKPDLSFLLKACMRSLKREKLTIDSILTLIYKKDIDYEMMKFVDFHFDKSLCIANELNFQIIIPIILKFRTMINNYDRKIFKLKYL